MLSLGTLLGVIDTYKFINMPEFMRYLIEDTFIQFRIVASLLLDLRGSPVRKFIQKPNVY